MKHKLLYLLPVSVLLSGLTGCATVDEREYPPRDHPYYEPWPVYSDYDYYFYPNVAVYLQISTGFYFYEDHGRWVRVRQLPPHIHLDARYRRHMVIRDPYPYIRYHEHVRLYGGRDDDRREPRMQGAPGGDDRPRGYDKDRGPEGRPDAHPVPRRPSHDDAAPPGARGSGERGESKDAGPPGKPGESSRRDTGKQDGQGGKGRSPGSRDDDEDDRDQPRDRDRRGPGTR